MNEINDYIEDCVEPQYITDSLVPLLYRLGTNYDQLNAIARELNLGESIENILKYLNLGLLEERYEYYDMTLTFRTGVTYTKRIGLDILYPEYSFGMNQTFNTKTGRVNYDFSFHAPSEAFVFDNDQIMFDLSKITDKEDANETYTPDEDDDVTFALLDDLISVELKTREKTLNY